MLLRECSFAHTMVSKETESSVMLQEYIICISYNTYGAHLLVKGAIPKEEKYWALVKGKSALNREIMRKRKNQAPIPPCRSNDPSKSSTRSINMEAAIESQYAFVDKFMH